MKNLENSNNFNSSFFSDSSVFLKKIRIVVKVVAGAGILIFVGAGVVLASRVWDPFWNPFRPNPRKVIGKMIEKMVEVKTFHSNARARIKTSGDQPAQMLIKIDGDSDIADSQNPRTASNFKFRIEEEKEGYLFLEGKIKSVKDASYLKLDRVDLSPELKFYLEMLGINESKIIGQWFKINKTTEGAKGGSEQLELPKGEQEKAKKEVIELLKKRRIYTVKKMPDEEINGKKAYHYILSLNKKEVKKMIPELFDIVKKYSNKESKEELNKAGTAEIEKIKQSIDEFFEKINGLDIEVWIGREDYLLYKVKADKGIEMGALEKGSKGSLEVSFDLTLSKFNQPMKIEMPQKFLDMNDLLPPLIQSNYSQEQNNQE